MKEGSVRSSAAAAESNSASASSRPSNMPSNTSMPKGGTLKRVLQSFFARQLRKHGKLILGEIHVCDPPPLRPAGQRRKFLGQLEDCGTTVFTLFSYAQSSAVDVEIGEPTDSDHIEHYEGIG
jgi:hypothetical protein